MNSCSLLVWKSPIGLEESMEYTPTSWKKKTPKRYELMKPVGLKTTHRFRGIYGIHHNLVKGKNPPKDMNSCRLLGWKSPIGLEESMQYIPTSWKKKTPKRYELMKPVGSWTDYVPKSTRTLSHHRVADKAQYISDTGDMEVRPMSLECD